MVVAMFLLIISAVTAFWHSHPAAIPVVVAFVALGLASYVAWDVHVQRGVRATQERHKATLVTFSDWDVREIPDEVIVAVTITIAGRHHVAHVHGMAHRWPKRILHQQEYLEGEKSALSTKAVGVTRFAFYVPVHNTRRWHRKIHLTFQVIVPEIGLDRRGTTTHTVIGPPIGDMEDFPTPPISQASHGKDTGSRGC